MFPAQRRDRSALHAMEVVNCDGHKIDVTCVWPDGTKGRPVIWAFQDVYSGKTLSWRVDRTENTDSFRLAFADMVTQQLQCNGNLADDLGIASNAQWRIVGAGAARLSEANASPNLPYVPLVMAALYDGTTLYLRRNGTQTASAAWTKPSWTADSFSLLANGPGSSVYCGEVGEVVLRADYSLSDAAQIEAWLAAA